MARLQIYFEDSEEDARSTSRGLFTIVEMPGIDYLSLMAGVGCFGVDEGASRQSTNHDSSADRRSTQYYEPSPDDAVFVREVKDDVYFVGKMPAIAGQI